MRYFLRLRRRYHVVPSKAAVIPDHLKPPQLLPILNLAPINFPAGMPMFIHGAAIPFFPMIWKVDMAYKKYEKAFSYVSLFLIFLYYVLIGTTTSNYMLFGYLYILYRVYRKKPITTNTITLLAYETAQLLESTGHSYGYNIFAGYDNDIITMFGVGIYTIVTEVLERIYK